MKKFSFITLATTVLSVSALAGCGGSSKPVISIWVGNETGVVSFYQKTVDAFLEKEGLNFKAQVKGTDLGSIAGTILNDPSACADIYSVAHDNIGKLATNSCARPFTEESLLTQIEADNAKSFVDVTKVVVNEKQYTFAAPYISQALFLMYDTRYVSAEQAQSFEGLEAAAAAASVTLGKTVKSSYVVGTDGFNFAFPILALENETKTSTVKLYDNESTNDGNVWCQGDDTVAVTKYLRNSKARANGFGFPSDAGWVLDIQNNLAVSLIGGAWHYESFASAVGKENVGMTLIPTLTLTAADAFGTAVAGTTYRGGTFADCKVLMINSKADKSKLEAEQKIVKYLSSMEVQKLAFKSVGVVPAYKSFNSSDAEFADVDKSSVNLAAAQIGMNEYGRPQPFTTTKLNNYYYQMGAPEAYLAIVNNDKGAYSTDRKVQEGLYSVQYIWQNGEKPSSIPEVLPATQVKK